MLLDKLYKIGIRGNLLCLIQSQYVCYNLQYQVKNLSSGHNFFYGIHEQFF